MIDYENLMPVSFKKSQFRPKAKTQQIKVEEDSIVGENEDDQVGKEQARTHKLSRGVSSMAMSPKSQRICPVN